MWPRPAPGGGGNVFSLHNVLVRYYIIGMKRRDAAPGTDRTALDELIQAVLTLRSPGEVRAFLEDLCTPAELEAMADRWHVVPLLIEDVPYREIHDRTGVSVTTIGRVARCLELGAGGYRLVAERLGHRPAQADADQALLGREALYPPSRSGK
jgi:TrpR-related protein YerC/YecD